MDKPTVVRDKNEVSYFKLNNQLNRVVDGNIDLRKDKEATKALFLEKINPNTVFFHTLEEKIDYLIEHDYIEEEFIKKYNFKFIKQLFKKAYDFKFRFKSFMSAYKFYQQYALKTNDGEHYLERYEDRNAFTALFLADGDEQLATDILTELMNQSYQPATPTFLNVGKKRRGEFVSCFLIDVPDDMSGIARAITQSLELSKRGGGVGINLSNIREAGAPIKGVKNASSGVIPVMKLLEDSFSYANQLGQRSGAGAVYLSVFHPDIVSFLSTKKENADEKIRVKTLSLGVTVPDKFYELTAKDEVMYLFSPYDVEREYGQPFAYIDITKEYENLIANDNITKYKIKARELENEISKLQQESGYPYIFNVDTANKENNIDGRIIMSNLCSEVSQVHFPSKVNESQEFEELGRDVSCNLGSLNSTNLLKSKDFGKSIDVAVRALTHISIVSDFKVAPGVQNANKLYHSIGLGVMGLHTTFAVNQMHYGSEDSLELTDVLFRTIRFYAMKSSMTIAKEKNVKFYDFDKSKYATGEFFDKYITGNLRWKGFKSEKVANVFKDIKVPTEEDWSLLKSQVQEHGLFHSYLMTIAPTGSISYVQNASASIHPIVNLIEERQEKKTGKTYYPAPLLSNETLPYYKSAYDIDMRKVIDVYATAQKHVDQSQSLTLFMRSEIPEGMYEWKNGKTNKMTTRDLNILRHYAWHKGIKSIYYIRTFTADGENDVNICESCSV